MPLRWASCLFRPARGNSTSLEINPCACPAELQEQLASRGTACLRPRGSHIIYERVDDAGQGAFTPPVVIYIKRLPVCGGLDVCIKRTQVTHFVGRAAREARLQVQLQHPHLLPALASVRGRHHYYLLLPAADGDLWAEAEAMRQQGTGYGEGELREVARQILLGLEHLHASGLAHRDIKPANVLRLPDGRVAVADFGCADGCTTGFVAAGTTQFQPPECRRNADAQLAVLPKGYDQRAQDMWSLGATLAALWFAALPEVIRGSGSSRVSSAAAAAAAVADAAAAAACGGGSGAEHRGSSGGSTELTPARTSDGLAAPAALPRCLALAGFAACQRTVGAGGSAMSDALLDLLSKLLRLRPSERLTASQALQHEWLAAAGASADGFQAPCEAAASPIMTPAAAEGERAAAAEPAAASLPPSPRGRGRASGDGRFMPFVSHQQLRLGEVTSTPQPPSTSEAPPTADGADGLDQLPSTCLRHHRHLDKQHQHPPPLKQCARFSSGGASSASGSTVPATPGGSSRTSPTQQHSADAALRRGGGCGKALSTSSPEGRGPGLCGGEGSSPAASQTSRSPGEEAQQLALRQQQQQQVQQSSSSLWLLRPSSQTAQNPKRAQRAILRVFVGAGGDSSGST